MQWIAIEDRVIELEAGLVHHAKDSSPLPPRLLALLHYFIEHPDTVIPRDTLIEAVWGHLEAATDDSINVAVSSLRQAIGDTRRPHRIIKAVPRRGYRFDSSSLRLLDVDEAKALMAQKSAATIRTRSTTPPSGNAARTSVLLPAALVLAAVLVIAITLARMLPWRDSAPGRADLGRAVAVLPFVDMTADGDHGPFADGLADRIIHLLTLSPDLDVTARTSSFAFRGSQARINEIAKSLGVDVVLEGSVQRADDQVRVLAQLIDADSEMHLWSRTYDRPIGELFALQDEIANEVARTMTDTLLPDRDTPHADSQQVWELITRGRVAMDRFTLDSATAAVNHFQEALELEPDNVDALIGLFDALGMQRSQGPMRTNRDTVDIREPYLERAQLIAGDSATVIRATGDWHFSHNRPDEAISSFRRALEINPNDAMAWRHLGRILFRQGRFDEAIEPLRRAVRLDPYMGLGQVWLADAFWSVGRAEEALFRLRDIIEKQPGFPQAHDRLATYLVQTGETAKAMQHILRAQSLDPASTARAFRVCEFWLQLGDDHAAERCSEEFAAAHDDPFREGYLRQILAGFRGDRVSQQRELEAIVAMNKRDPLTAALLAQVYSHEDCPAALSLLEERFPSLFDAPPELNPMQLMPARPAIECLQRQGRSDEAEALLAAHSRAVERTRLEQGPWLVVGYETVLDHALHGNYEAALDALEELVEDDWRYYWWGLDFYFPSLQPIVGTERFKRLIAELEAGVAEQRAQFRAMQTAASNDSV
jgi:TolB-like protein/DNA-binding winged helix-turn-helix (wHTH) protein/tetratricopeptide (TPR) repeat protein